MITCRQSLRRARNIERDEMVESTCIADPKTWEDEWLSMIRTLCESSTNLLCILCFGNK